MKSVAFRGEVWINTHEKIIESMVRANADGVDGGYGADSHSLSAIDLMQRNFSTKIAATFTYNGTAANVLALKSMLDRTASVICAKQAHINTYEAGAYEYNLGNKIMNIECPDGKLTVELVKKLLRDTANYKYNPRVLVLTQPTEFGTVYTGAEIKSLCDFAHANGMHVYVDGARIGNAADYLNISLREMLEVPGVDVFSFGGTKAGAMFGEMIVYLRGGFEKDKAYTQKQSLQHLPKSKFLGVQLLTVLRENLWLENAHLSNIAAGKLERGLLAKGVTFVYPRQTNMIFCKTSPEQLEKLLQKYDLHYWDIDGQVLRLSTTYRTTDAEIEDILSLL
jgi:threonine aldolase